VFEKKLEKTDARHGEKIRLKCRLKYSNATKITWRKDGEEITEDNSRYKFSKSTSKPFIELKKVLHSDAGEYTIEASNDCGSASCSATLCVQGRLS